MQPLKLCATQKHPSTFGKQTRTAYNTAKLKEAKFSTRTAYNTAKLKEAKFSTCTAYNTAKLKEAKFSLSRSNENAHDRFPGNYKDSVGPSSILGRLIAANPLAVY